MATVGGPGLEAQMREFGGDENVEELIRVYRAHNEPLHSELQLCFGMDDVLIRLKDEGRKLGIVSAKRRQINSLKPGYKIYNVIQTDAAINHGNSGGPLIDRFGNVIGITNQILTGTNNPQSGNIGIGFAVPINAARTVAREIIATGRAVHTYLGIAGVELTPAIARVIDLPVDRGVLVGLVRTGSPAARAGLRGGSATATVDGETLTVTRPTDRGGGRHAFSFIRRDRQAWQGLSLPGAPRSRRSPYSASLCRRSVRCKRNAPRPRRRTAQAYLFGRTCPTAVSGSEASIPHRPWTVAPFWRQTSSTADWSSSMARTK